MNSPTLGYVDAMHQSLRTFARSNRVDVLLGAGGRVRRRRNRRVLHGKGLGLLEGSDPRRISSGCIRASGSCVSRVDIMRMGHAMVRPTVGSIFAAERQTLWRGIDGLLFAHSDVSGLSLFEEAQYAVSPPRIVRGACCADPRMVRRRTKTHSEPATRGGIRATRR